jgi:hypothetical protein
VVRLINSHGCLKRSPGTWQADHGGDTTRDTGPQRKVHPQPEVTFNPVRTISNSAPRRADAPVKEPRDIGRAIGLLAEKKPCPRQSPAGAVRVFAGRQACNKIVQQLRGSNNRLGPISFPVPRIRFLEDVRCIQRRTTLSMAFLGR